MANAVIRQEINILDAILSAAGGSSATSNEIVQLVTTQYNGATFYFEIVADSTISISFTVTLRRSGTSTDDATCTIPLLTTAYTRIRSASFSPPAGATEYRVFIDATVGATKNVKSAKIIVIQNASSILNTETQLEIGNNETGLNNTVIGALTNPKYWLYSTANWNGTMIAYAEVVYARTSSMSSMTIRLEEDNGSFGGWTTKITLVSAGTATTPTRKRGWFIPTAGKNYRISSLQSDTMNGTGAIYCAKIVIDQCGSAGAGGDANSGVNIQGGTAASAQTSQSCAQPFFISSGGVAAITGVILMLQKFGTPVDTLSVKIVSTLDGSALASGTISASSITAGSYNQYTITFGTPWTPTADTQYYIQLSRSPDTSDVSNFIAWDSQDPSGFVASASTRSNNSWIAGNSTLWFSFTGISDPTKIEPQYLILNTADGGTGLQTYQTLWDATEWNDTQGGLPTFKYSHDATNAADSSKLVDITNANTDVSGATVTGANQQISAGFTMPTTGHELDTNVTNSTGVVGAVRIIVLYVVNSVSFTWQQLTEISQPYKEKIEIVEY